MTIKTFVFNPFQLNTFVVYDETKAAIIIDAGNSTTEENNELFNFIAQEQLSIEGLYYTHAHVDHIIGNNDILKKYNIEAYAGVDSDVFFENAEGHAKSLGFSFNKLITPLITIKDNDEVKFGNSSLRAISTPGHADGSICFYSEKDQFIIAGDVLFRDSIGRTDLPTGNFDLLARSIIDKLYVLPVGVKVYPGHGPTTTIGYEKSNNPFVSESEHL
ncbi:MAG: MBL fold metallo-hydrolase [Bacteroidales bacterium]|nr:MBL fold metallo-hydrolase [Bacteroidales bacterium]